MGLAKIAKYANSFGVKTKQGKTFNSRTINYILNNPVYIGKARWTPTEKFNWNFNHPDTITKDSNHEPIIDIETWDKVQERLKEYKEVYRPYEKTTSRIATWLKGIVKCSACGRVLCVSAKKYLQCNSYLKGGCKTSSHIAIATIEKLVLEELQKTYAGEVEINIAPRTKDAGATLESEVLQERLNKISDKENRVKMAFEDGIDTLDEYKDNKNRLSAEREELKKALEMLKTTLIENQHNSEVVSRITSVYEILTDETLDIEQKYQTAHMLIEEVVYSRAEKTLKLVYK
jgi:hypothetical protein